MFSIKSLAIVATAVSLWVGFFAFKNETYELAVKQLLEVSFLLAFTPFLLRSNHHGRSFLYGYGASGLYFTYLTNGKDLPAVISMQICRLFHITDTTVEPHPTSPMDFYAGGNQQLVIGAIVEQDPFWTTRVETLTVFLLCISLGLLTLALSWGSSR